MHKELRPPGERPDPSLAITRRIFLHKSLLAGAAAGTATYGWFPLINTLDVAFGAEALDRKSTRLNSSHSQISYAVFCLKKKKKKIISPYAYDNSHLSHRVKCHPHTC